MWQHIGTYMAKCRLVIVVVVLAGCGEEPPLTNESSPKQTISEAEQLYRKGTELLETDPERAIEYLTRSLEVGPDAPPALYNRAVAYARVGRDSEAVADIDRLEKVAPDIGRELRAEMALAAIPYLDIANREFEAGNFEKAFEKCNSALAYDPAYGNAWVGKGLALYKLGKIEEALACYNKAAELEPDNYHAYINRADLHHEQKRLQQALADFNKAIEVAPDKSAPYLGRSAVYSDLQMPDQAAEDKQRSQELETSTENESEMPHNTE